jgi:hypothetical protein
VTSGLIGPGAPDVSGALDGVGACDIAGEESALPRIPVTSTSEQIAATTANT